VLSVSNCFIWKPKQSTCMITFNKSIQDRMRRGRTWRPTGKCHKKDVAHANRLEQPRESCVCSLFRMEARPASITFDHLKVPSVKERYKGCCPRGQCAEVLLPSTWRIPFQARAAGGDAAKGSVSTVSYLNARPCSP
jgi:hypothetical protein